MKKIITLLLAVGSLASVYAQRGHDDQGYQNNKNYENKGYAYNDRHGVSNSFYNRERIYQLEKVNREYDFRIEAVVRNRYMRPGEKNRLIRRLEIERANSIRDINGRYNSARFGDDRYDRNNGYHH